MLETVTRWRVLVRQANGEMVFLVHDRFLANVLRQLAVMQFSDNGLEQPQEIVISAVN